MKASKSLLATAVFAVVGGSVAYAAQATAQPAGPGVQVSDGPLYDPAQLPSFKGKVTHYDLTPRGDVDGLILDDNTEVHFSPRQSTLLVATVKPGDSVTVHGLKARELPLIKALSITQDASGQSVVANERGHRGFGGHEGGPEHHFWPHWFGHGPEMPPPGGPEGHGGPGGGPDGAPPPPPPGEHGDHGGWGDRGPQLSASGTVKMQLHGPRGELNGVLLDDGTEVHFAPPQAASLGDALAVGKTVAVKGPGSKTVLGTSLAAFEFGASASSLKPLAPPMPPHGWGHGPQDGGAHHGDKHGQ